jgi:UDP-N-acetylmuramoylalanine--D-glutamate ligase
VRPRPQLPAGPYLIVGLARSGVAVAKALRQRGEGQRGEEVIGVDAGTAEKIGPAALEELARAGVEVHTGEDGRELLDRVRAVIKSPGVPRQVPVVADALRRGMPVLGELEAGWRMLENEVIAVTGTNGKTTTVEWIGHIHRSADLPVAVAGNVGTALSALVGTVDPRATIVCEASSFQLEDTLAFAPEAAVLLNISPDHLDRHGSVEAYTEAKLKIFEHQTQDDVAVLPSGLDVEIPGEARRIAWDETSTGAGGPPVETPPFDGGGGFFGEETISLPGRHNRENAMAAAVVCLARGIAPDAVREGLRTFKGVEHRLQEVARKGGVAYVNDSKATNVASTLVALEAYPAGAVHLILGGQGKGQDFSALTTVVQRACRAVYLIGEDAALIAEALSATNIRAYECGDLTHALSAAKAQAKPGEVVLLSPACASYDQFKDYEVRGEKFRELVTSLS